MLQVAVAVLQQKRERTLPPARHPNALDGDPCVSCGRSKEDIGKWKRMKRSGKIAAVQRANVRFKELKKVHQ
ncbi:DUF1289 domain-containing protein [Pseudomonas azerbaijanorientalis]|nr:DUF1289 domain-containing protein [Pseudomonas azerbaijanorientalis]